MPIVPGVHDAAELRAEVAFLATLSSPVRVRLVPYHPVGDSKYVQLGRPAPCFQGDVENLVQTARQLLAEAGMAPLPEP
jgi:pyruvate-formate lyase-activating enzyme